MHAKEFFSFFYSNKNIFCMAHLTTKLYINIGINIEMFYFQLQRDNQMFNLFNSELIDIQCSSSLLIIYDGKGQYDK